jgi:hypothetical protein
MQLPAQLPNTPTLRVPSQNISSTYNIHKKKKKKKKRRRLDKAHLLATTRRSGALLRGANGNDEGLAMAAAGYFPPSLHSSP